MPGIENLKDFYNKEDKSGMEKVKTIKKKRTKNKPKTK